MLGRKRKPIEQQIAEGDPRKRGVHKLKQELLAQPPASKGLPPCPKHITDPVARKKWDELKAELEAMDIDRRPDATMLEGACVNYAVAVMAAEHLCKYGLMLDEPVVANGNLVGYKRRKNPAESILIKAWGQARLFLTEFAMSPTSRLRLPARTDDPATTDLMEMLAKPRDKKSSLTVQ